MLKEKGTRQKCGEFLKKGTNQRLELLYVSSKGSSIPSRCMMTTGTWRNISRKSNDSNAKSKSKAKKYPIQATSAYYSTAHLKGTTSRSASWKRRTTLHPR